MRAVRSAHPTSKEPPKATFDLADRIDAHSEAANELHSQNADAVGLGGRAASLADRANQSGTLASDLEIINE